MKAFSHGAGSLLSPVTMLLWASCAPIHPTSEGICISECGDSLSHARVVVWSHDPTVEQLLLDWARTYDGQVVDPDQARETIRQHQLSLELKPGVEEVLRRLGKLHAANHVLVGAVSPRSHALYVMYSGYKEGHPRVTTVFDPIVTVRSLGVDPPIVYWSVTVTGPSPTFALEPTVGDLTQTALQRATCEADSESQWTDETGCVKKQ